MQACLLHLYMKIILVGGRFGRSRDLNLDRRARALLAIAILGLPVGAGALGGYLVGAGDRAALGQLETQALRARLFARGAELAALERAKERELAALAARVARLQARLVRLDSLGERVATTAKLDKSEFDFSADPGLGGPDEEMTAAAVAMHTTDVVQTVDQLVARVAEREQQFELMQELLVNLQVEQDRHLSGRPIRKGYVSSGYGVRSDPFHGRRTRHRGLDFAGPAGSDVIAVASGVVVSAGKKGAYGNLVDVEHGNGYVTRYAHNQALLVKPGDLVKKGQVIALLGSTGRSTAPHLHFEVLHEGRRVNPAEYLRRADR